MTSIILMPTFACFLKFLSTIYAPKETKVLCEKWGSLGWYDKKKVGGEERGCYRN